MRYWNTVLFVIIINMIVNGLTAQESWDRKLSFQIDYGVSRTLHYNDPIAFTLCYEGCPPNEQKAQLASNINLNIYRQISKSNSIHLGIGFSEYRFSEKGEVFGGIAPKSFDRIQSFKYLNVAAGFRHVFKRQKLLQPFIESSLLYEMRLEGSSLLKRGSFAISPKVGTIIQLSNRLNVIVQAFFKTGIVRYNRWKVMKNYLPYGYGLQLGFNYQL